MEDAVFWLIERNVKKVQALMLSLWAADCLACARQSQLPGSSAIIRIREMAKSWNTKEEQITVIGFSAGGDLAGACTCMWNCPELSAQMDTCGGKTARMRQSWGIRWCWLGNWPMALPLPIWQGKITNVCFRNEGGSLHLWTKYQAKSTSQFM